MRVLIEGVYSIVETVDGVVELENEEGESLAVVQFDSDFFLLQDDEDE